MEKLRFEDRITGFQELGIESKELNMNAVNIIFNFFEDFIINYFNDFTSLCGESLEKTINGTREEVEDALLDKDDLARKSRQERNLLRNKIKKGKHKKFFIQIKKNIETCIIKYNEGVIQLKNTDGKYNIGNLIDFSLKHFDNEYFEDEIVEMRKMTIKIKELLIYIIINNIKDSLAQNILKTHGIEHTGELDMEKVNSAMSIMTLYGNSKIKHLKEGIGFSEDKNKQYREIILLLKEENIRLSQEKESKEKENNTLRKTLANSEESNKTLYNQVNNLRQSSSKLNLELENLKNQNQELQNINEGLKKSGNNGNGEEWQEMALGLDEENDKLKQEIKRLGETIDIQLKQIQLLQNKVNFLLEDDINQIKLLRFKVENEQDKCSIDELIKYITISNISIETKQELVNIISKFLDQFKQDITGGSSSSTNINASHKKGEGVGKGSGCYANKFVNPLLNFLEQKRQNLGTIGYLEYITELNITKFIGEYKSGEILSVGNKKDSLMLKVYNSIIEQGFKNTIGLYESLIMLSIVFENTDHGDLDLSLLSYKIKESLNRHNFRKELENLLEKIIN